jgi:hypothetical protein
MRRILLIVNLILSLPAFILSQELEATVEINYEQLQVAARERLDNFKNQVQDYLNNTKFTQQAWEGEKIKCSFNVFFIGSSDETTYSAQVVVASQRPIEGTKLSSLMLNIMDGNWTFKYQKNQAMYFNQSDFDPLTGLLDFYAYIIIGFDLDSYYKLGGSEMFNKALDLTIRGANSKYGEGWQLKSTAYNRRALVENLLNAKFQQMREDIFEYHYNGLDLFYTDDRQTAMKNMARLIYNLYNVRDQLDPRSAFLKVFFDAKAGEIVEYLKGYPDKEIFTKLKKIDPPHISKYDEALK